MKKLSILAGVMVMFLMNGCFAYSPEENTEQFVNSSVISNSIRVRLAQQAGLEALTLHVDTIKGKVLLSGFAQNEQQKILAGKVANNTQGVTEVINSIVVQ